VGARGQSRAKAQNHIVFQGEWRVDVQAERPVQSAVRPDREVFLEVFVTRERQSPIDQGSRPERKPADLAVDQREQPPRRARRDQGGQKVGEKQPRPYDIDAGLFAQNADERARSASSIRST
jgi:hypothetical protein